MNTQGSRGMHGTISTGVFLGNVRGGDAQLGRGAITAASSAGSAGNAGQAYGGGAAPAFNNASQAAKAGAIGGGGIVIVTTYLA